MAPGGSRSTSRAEQTRRGLFGLALSATTLAPGGIRAQGTERRPMRWVVPWPPGGSTDVIARLLANAVAPQFDQPIVIENRSGAGGMLGTEYVAKADPDGLTVLVSDGTLATGPSLYRSLRFDPQKDLRAVALFVTLPHVIAVRPDFPARTLAEFVAEAKRRGTALNFGSGGIGSPLHLAGELFRSTAGIEWTHVPYRGAGPAVTALLAGEVQVATPSLPAVVGHIRDGRLRGLAVTGSQRAPLLPDVPTVAEAGLPAAEMAGWVGLHVPAGTPATEMARLQAASLAAIGQADLRARLQQQGAQIVGQDGAAYASFVAAEAAKWSRVIREAGIDPE